jgi:hypothetical protein
MDQSQTLLYRIRPKNWLRALAYLLPREIRAKIARNLLSLKPWKRADFQIKLAESQLEIEGALQILHDEYVRNGLMKLHSSCLALTTYHALPHTYLLVAKCGDDVVGTMTLICDSNYGLPIERFYSLKPFRKFNAQLLEMSHLAISQEYRQNGGKILWPLLKFAAAFARNLLQADYIFCAVEPHNLDFFENILLLERIENRVIENYQFFNGARAIGLFADVRQTANKIEQLYSGKHSQTNLSSYLQKSDFTATKLPDSKEFDVTKPFLDRELIRYFFSERTNLFDSLPEYDKSILNNLYDEQQYAGVLPTSDGVTFGSGIREQSRYQMQCDGRIVLHRDKTVSLTIIDISINGFRAQLHEPIHFGSKVQVTVSLPDQHLADLEAWAVWQDRQSKIGFKIAKCSNNWIDFVESVAENAKKHLEPQGSFQPTFSLKDDKGAA